MKKLLLLLCVTSLHTFAQTPNFKKVKGGEFEMGNPNGRKDEAPRHKVTLESFEISEAPITVSQYKKYCTDRGLKMPEAPSWGWKENHPIVNVRWSDAINYCNWLSAMLKQKVTLPTEAQWEYAARGGSDGKNYKHSGGKKINQVGWSRGDQISSTQPVKTKKPNELGIYDMNGNTWEWCFDWYEPHYYGLGPSTNPKNETLGKKTCRVARGGGWDSDPKTCTVSHRKNYMPKSSFDDRGFRVVINPSN